MEGGAKQDDLATVRKGEAAIVSYCTPFAPRPANCSAELANPVSLTTNV
jgi:hypothetical protein